MTALLYLGRIYTFSACMLLNVFKITLSVAAVIMPIAEAKALKAEAPAFHFTYLSSKEGLSSNNVYAILKDKYGFLWFGTDDGLNKFDGLNITVNRKAAGDKYSLQANEITSLHEDKEGRLWIGTNGGGVSLYDRNNNRFITIPAGSLTHGIS